MATILEPPLKHVPRGKPAVPDNRGIKVVKSCTINTPREMVYQFWRRLENLPKFMDNLVSVTEVSDKESHWVAKSPRGKNVEWNAIIIEDHPGELISWRTVEGSEIDHAGSVRFRAAPGNRGTEVIVKFEYQAPGGKIGAKLAKLTGKEPGQQVEKDLLRFKALIETGEIPTVKGQTSGKRD